MISQHRDTGRISRLPVRADVSLRYSTQFADKRPAPMYIYHIRRIYTYPSRPHSKLGRISHRVRIALYSERALRLGAYYIEKVRVSLYITMYTL